MDNFIKDKVKVICNELYKLTEKRIIEISYLKYIQVDYKTSEMCPVPDGEWKDFKRGDRVFGKDAHFWFYAEIKTPKAEDNIEYALELVTTCDGDWNASNPQGLLYLDGNLVQGLDLNHRKAYLKADTRYKVHIYFYTSMIESGTDVMLNIKSVDIPVRDLFYDLKVPYDAAMCFDENDYAHIKTIRCLDRACNLLDLRCPGSKDFYNSIEKAREYIKEEYFEKECGKSDVIVSYIGHTHIDVAWLWTLAQTREKVQRSFSTVLALMERYPEYIFMSSQPQLYEYLKEEAPVTYEKVKEMVKVGRWEVEGAMWLEADCNLSSGESLIRQITHGKRFMEEEFGVKSHILWLPDVFGYSAALPQILYKTGVDKFVTSKISWNESNRMPYDSFMWEGIDGTEIFTYFLTAQSHRDYLIDKTYTTYNGILTPETNLGTWERYQQKEYNNETIVSFGYGDGGGGPTEEMLENYRRLNFGLPGMPKAQMSFVGDFLARVKENFDKNCEATGRILRWVGELYLEFHRGTYTSRAKNKRNNRKGEFLCMGTETLSAISMLLLNEKYPQDELYRNWRVLLLNQFHDIIPGSSIEEVYVDSDKQYKELFDEVGELKKNKLERLFSNVSKKGIFVYNPNSFTASGYAKYNDKLIYVRDIPAMGWKVLDSTADSGTISVSDNEIESRYYSITFDKNMNIVSLYDKENDREVVGNNGVYNQIVAFEDFPRAHDNWEISSYYKDKQFAVNNVIEVESFTGNGYGGLLITRKYLNSEIKQKITLYSESRRIDFETEIDWHENHTVLKALFPTNVHTNKATYEIQFGNLERPTYENTSWDKARFEVCAHKWCDLSEEGYGVSLLNDCKYGHSALGNEMTLTFLKCGTDPNSKSDEGVHKFTYSIYPHKDSFKKAGTINEAYLLNRPFEVCEAQGTGDLPAEYSFVNCDCDNIVIETVKKADKKDGIVLRLYDSWNMKSNPALNFGFDCKKVYLCDMLENPIAEIGNGNSIRLYVKNFEIVTLYLEIW